MEVRAVFITNLKHTLGSWLCTVRNQAVTVAIPQCKPLGYATEAVIHFE